MEIQPWQTPPAAITLFEPLIRDFKTGLAKRHPASLLQAYLMAQGQKLWREAVQRAQQQADFDDRPLYWSRLLMLHHLHAYLVDLESKRPLSQSALQLLVVFEKASRGLEHPPQDAPASNSKRILISGFDPFGLHTCSEKSNTSGACVLALHQQNLVAEGVSAQVTGAIFPVRYNDFDKGIVEAFFKPFLDLSRAPDLVMTISQNQNGFKVERFAGRRRSTESFTDNAGCVGGGSRLHPIAPAGLATGPEFIETGLPAAIIRSALGRTEPLADELRFMELCGGQNPSQAADWKFTTPAEDSIAVCGSGGGFLSNEIFYRTSLLRLHSMHKQLPMGHLHIPALNDNNDAKQRSEIVSMVKKVLLQTLPHL